MGGPKIYDISLPISESLVVWQGDPPVRITYLSHLADGDHSTLSQLNLGAHVGTHVDAPAHFILGGRSVEQLDLNLLIGSALVVDTGNAVELSEDILKSLPIPAGTERILFHTSNSERWARGDKDFAEDYVGITEDGARWLVSQGIRLVGIDYLSVAGFTETLSVHQILLTAGVIPLEGLNLSGVKPGRYMLICLPLRIADGDGAPARAVLIQDYETT